MTATQYKTCIDEATNYTNPNSFVSDLATSSIWGDDPDTDIPADRIAQLTSIYAAVHRSVKDIAKDAGLSQRKLAERFCIPLRTMEDWCTGKRTPPDYVRFMIQECLGLLKR